MDELAEDLGDLRDRSCKSRLQVQRLHSGQRSMEWSLTNQALTSTVLSIFQTGLLPHRGQRIEKQSHAKDATPNRMKLIASSNRPAKLVIVAPFTAEMKTTISKTVVSIIK